jgi:hypothetical protein
MYDSLSEKVEGFREYVHNDDEILDDSEALDDALAEFVNTDLDLTADDFDAILEHLSSHGWYTTGSE